MSLLDKAMAAGRRWQGTVVTTEHMDLALAWADGKISGTQVAVALGVHQGTQYPILARALRDAIRSGRLKVVEPQP